MQFFYVNQETLNALRDKSYDMSPEDFIESLEDQMDLGDITLEEAIALLNDMFSD